MASFSSERRDPLLEEDVFYQKRKYYINNVLDDQELDDMINDEERDKDHRIRLGWGRCSDSLQHSVLSYSAGKPLPEVEQLTTSSLVFFSTQKSIFPNESMQHWEQDSYQYYLWLFSLAVMTGQPEKIADLMRWYSPDPDGDGEDPLLGSLMARLGVGMPDLPLASELTFPKSYGALYEAVQGDDSRPKEERQECIQRYLKSWYQGMKECYWYGRHKSEFAIYFGYWAFEAGLVTLLYGLDDSSYRDMKYYPKDLVDHAREKGYDQVLDPARMTDQLRHDILLPGSSTPYAARWKSNLLPEELTLAAGQTLPGPERSELNPSHVHFWISFRD